MGRSSADQSERIPSYPENGLGLSSTSSVSSGLTARMHTSQKMGSFST